MKPPARRAVLLSLLGISCGGPPPSELAATRAAVTNGHDDDGDPATVALLRGDIAYCSGALIAPRVVLTAAHCLDVTPPEAVFFGGRPGEGGATIPVIDARKHPDYVSASLGDDLGLVLLAAPAAPAPVPLLRGALDESFVGRAARLVGFGQSSAADHNAARKREGVALVAAVEARLVTVGPAPSLPCAGDSGGPVFLTVGGAELVAGVVSEGDPGCAVKGRITRVDVYFDAFVRPYLEATVEGAAGVGQRCFYAANCASGICHAPPDAPGFSYCSAPCGRDADCPGGMTCAPVAGGAACRHPPPSPGALGAPCARPSDCAFGMCGRYRSADPRVCSVLCFPSEMLVCPKRYSCRRNLDTDKAFGCFADPPPSDAGVHQAAPPMGGCAVGGGRPPGGLALLAALHLLFSAFFAHRRAARRPRRRRHGRRDEGRRAPASAPSDEPRRRGRR